MPKNANKKGGKSEKTGNFFEDHSKVVEELDPYKVEDWTVEQVCTQFLDKLELSYLKQIFVDHKITGHVLMTLTKADLVEMQIHAVGDRVYLDRQLVELRRKYRKKEREEVLWKGVTPSGGIAYFDSIFDCLRYKLCPCCMRFTDWEVNAQGIRRRLNPPSLNICCQSMHVDFSDFRFLKDIDFYNEPMCFCFKNATRAEMIFDARSDFSVGVESASKDSSNRLTATVIKHPEMTEKQTLKIKNLWSEARLVAD